MPKPVKKSATPVKPAPVKAPPPPAPVLTQSQLIWKEIAGVPMEIFGLPGQTVAKYYQPFPGTLDPTKVFLVPTTNASAALPALEAALAAKYEVSKDDRFVVVSLKPAAR